MKTFCAPYVLGFALAFTAVPQAAHAAGVRVAVGVVTPGAPPPEVIPEDRPPVPGPGYYWVPGSWDWTGSDWAWSSGYWIPRRTGYAYVAPRYIWEGDHFVYHRAYWNGPRGYHEYGYGGWHGAPAVAWRAHPRYEPQVWRREHRAAVEHRAVVEHRAAEHRATERQAVEHRAVVQHREAEHHAANQRGADHRVVERRAAEHRQAVRQSAPPAHRVR
jgi:hypothetical protein